MPELDRIDRLHIIVAVNENCRKRRIHHLLAEHYRMTSGRIYRRLISTGLHKKLDKTLCTTLHVRLVLLQRAHGRNPQERKQLLEEPFFIILNIILHICGY